MDETKILILGGLGSMGTRYQAILKYKKINYEIFELGDVVDFDKFSAFIIATPTDTHYSFILKLAQYKKPILCEKPLSKNMDEINDIKDMVVNCGLNLTMMNQYEVLYNRINNKNISFDMGSYYSYFRSGKDGIFWDCIQIIGLHDRQYALLNIDNVSPVWKCRINQKWLSLSNMDEGYVEVVEEWLTGKNSSKILEHIWWHKKVLDYQSFMERNNVKCNNRNSGEVNLEEISKKSI